MHIWNTTNAALTLTSGPLLPHVFGSRLYFRDNAGVHELAGAGQANGTVQFGVTAAQVGAILAKQAYLFLTTRQVLHPGSPVLKWGWRYKLDQGGAPLAATDGSGAPLHLISGFYHSPLQAFDEPVELSRETIVLV